MRQRRSYDEPFGWWGPIWAPPAPRSIAELIRQGVLSAEVAALIAALLERRASIVVAAGPSGAGKTTLLTALLDFLPPGTRRVYVRGCYEPFDFLDTTDPWMTTLLVNEISGHLPIYLWGPGVLRVLSAARAGYQIAATAHATSVEEFVFGLTSYPLGVPAIDLMAIDLLVLLDAWRRPEGVCRMVREVVSLSHPAGSDRIEPARIAGWDAAADGLIIDGHAASELYQRLGGQAASFDQVIKARADALKRAGANTQHAGRAVGEELVIKP